MDKKWWQNAVVYQIYPRSFNDSNGDGIGDIQGIIEKLDYLRDLGISVIWLSPVCKSPMDDNGYDISDYRDIAPEFGTMEDMENLILEGKKRNIQILMDLVVNHTSDEHQWFIEAAKSKDSPYRDYYIFRQPLENGEPPSQIRSVFSGSAWELSPETNEYYFHMFSVKQPDLNWDNPKLGSEIYDMMNFWLDKGIGGFRMDVIELIGKDVDNMILSNGPTLHERLVEMNNATFGKRDVCTVGETWGVTPEIAKLYSNPNGNELSMVFQFEHVTAFLDEKFLRWKPKKVDMNVVTDMLTKWQIELADEGWNSLFWCNHDLPRSVSKYGSDKNYRIESAKMLATIIHMMKGTPYIYQGEEIGMTNVKFDSLSDYRDLELLNAYKEFVGNGLSHQEMMDGIYKESRDNARTPMQWNSEKNAGFTNGSPWIKVNPNYLDINVEKDIHSDNSIFNYYKELIGLRKKYDVIVYGGFERLETKNNNVFSYRRHNSDSEIIVIVNHSDESQITTLSTEYNRNYNVLLSNYTMDKNISITESFMLRPYESLILL